ncbi:hypothetical protein [Niallia sp. Marseille-Q9988]
MGEGTTIKLLDIVGERKGMNQEGIDAFHILLNRSSVFTRKPKGIQL